MASNNFSSFGDEIGETLVEQGGKAVKNVVGGAAQAVKQQVFDNTQQTQGNETQDTSSGIQEKEIETGSGKRSDSAQGKKIDPVTGRPVPSKKMLTQLNQQVAQLAQARIKKVREELEKQRLKVTGQPSSVTGQKDGPGPEVKEEPEKPKEDAVAKTLKAAKSTGEFKGLIGG